MLRTILATSVALLLAMPAAAQELRQVPRNRTLITQGWISTTRFRRPPI